ncbi:hypothetical protein Tco_0719107 [Tanacetum coccineum]
MKSLCCYKFGYEQVKVPPTKKIAHQGKKGKPRRGILNSLWCTFSMSGDIEHCSGSIKAQCKTLSYQNEESMEENLCKFIGESTKEITRTSNLIKRSKLPTAATIGDLIWANEGTKIRDHMDRNFQKSISYGSLHIDKSIPRKKKKKGPRESLLYPCYINNVDLVMPLFDLGSSDRDREYPKGIAKNVLVARRDQLMIFMPTIGRNGEVVEEFRARNDARMVSKVFGYPSDCDHDKKIRIDCAYNLKFSCMIDFAILEDMDAYRDKGMGDVILAKPLLREVQDYMHDGLKDMITFTMTVIWGSKPHDTGIDLDVIQSLFFSTVDTAYR